MRFGYFSNQNNKSMKKPYRQIVEETRELARYCDQLKRNQRQIS